MTGIPSENRQPMRRWETAVAVTHMLLREHEHLVQQRLALCRRRNQLLEAIVGARSIGSGIQDR